MFEEFGATMLG